MSDAGAVDASASAHQVGKGNQMENAAKGSAGSVGVGAPATAEQGSAGSDSGGLLVVDAKRVVLEHLFLDKAQLNLHSVWLTQIA